MATVSGRLANDDMVRIAIMFCVMYFMMFFAQERKPYLISSVELFKFESIYKDSNNGERLIVLIKAFL